MSLPPASPPPVSPASPAIASQADVSRSMPSSSSAVTASLGTPGAPIVQQVARSQPLTFICAGSPRHTKDSVWMVSCLRAPMSRIVMAERRLPHVECPASLRANRHTLLLLNAHFAKQVVPVSSAPPSQAQHLQQAAQQALELRELRAKLARGEFFRQRNCRAMAEMDGSAS